MQAGIDYDKVYLSPSSHASYYPGSKVMTMKILWEKGSKRLLGAQIIGADGVDKRIDVLAAAMAAGITAPQLAELDLAYAPPYSSAKDPVNMAGFMIENIVNGKVSQFFRGRRMRFPGTALNLVDVRTEGEYRFGHLEGFQNIPVDQLGETLQ